MEENSGKYVVYDGEIITPGSIKELKNHNIVRIVDKMMGGRKRRIARHVHQSHEEGNSIFKAMTKIDDEMIKEAMNKMRQSFEENSKKFGMEKQRAKEN